MRSFYNISDICILEAIIWEKQRALFLYCCIRTRSVHVHVSVLSQNHCILNPYHIIMLDKLRQSGRVTCI